MSAEFVDTDASPKPPEGASELRQRRCGRRLPFSEGVPFSTALLSRGDRKRFVILPVAVALTVAIAVGAARAATPIGTQFLLFELAPSAPAIAEHPANIPAKSEMEREVDDVVNSIGTRGDRQKRHLGFTIGPLMFDLSDDQLRAYIREAFQVAEEKEVAVAFHIDDSMFWNNRKDLSSVKDNVEWSDWTGTVVPHRIIGWVIDGRPVLAPPMCYNSPAITNEARRLARDVIGSEIKNNIDRLHAMGKPYLFAGVIAGWETRMQDDSHPQVFYGYCALHNLGYGAARPPADVDLALEGVVRDWVKVWTRGLRDAGIPRDRIYTHNGTARADAPTFLRNPVRDFYKDARPSVTAFNEYSYPGFTHSAASPGGFTQIYKLLAAKNNPPWGISEGSGVSQSNPFRNDSKGSSESGSYDPLMEQFLAGAMNHGAIYVNIYGWSHEDDAFSRTATARSAIEAYRKFLQGEPLADGGAHSGRPTSADNLDDLLPSKIQTIQSQAAAWMHAHPDRQMELRSLFMKLDDFLREKKEQDANEIADTILNLMDGPR